VKNAATLIEKAKTVGSVAYEKKTEVMELLGNDHGILAVEALVFGKADRFKYLGATVRSNNDWSVEIVNRVHKTEKAYLCIIEILQIQIEKDEIKIVYGCS